MLGKELLPLIKATGRDDNKGWEIFAGFSQASMMDGAPLVYNTGKTQSAQIIIGYGQKDGDGYVFGSRLSAIIGGRYEAFAYPPSFKIIELLDWWQGYIIGGKCFIDPEHRIYGAERWGVIGKKKRRCIWCENYTQIMRKVMKAHYSWENII